MEEWILGIILEALYNEQLKYDEGSLEYRQIETVITQLTQ